VRRTNSKRNLKEDISSSFSRFPVKKSAFEPYPAFELYFAIDCLAYFASIQSLRFNISGPNLPKAQIAAYPDKPIVLRVP
jgi:hypothetical protein